MSVNNANIVGAIQSHTVASPDDRTIPSDSPSRPTFQTRTYLGTTRYGVDLNWTLNKILDVSSGTDYMRSSTVSDSALSVMQDILDHIRSTTASQDSLPRKDFLTVGACILNNPLSRPEQKIKAALLLGEYYAHFKETEKAKNIYKALVADNTSSLGDMEVVDNRKDTDIPVRLADKLSGVVAAKPYKLQATARYHNLENRGTPNKTKLDAAIKAIATALQGQAATEETLYCFIESYSILAKLLAATKDPKLEAEALKIAAMLRSPEPVKGTKPEPIALNIGGETLSLPWVNASDKGATYFRTSAANTELQVLNRKATLSPAEESRRRALMAEIGATDSMADSYMRISIRHQQAEDLMSASASSPQQNRDNMDRAKALFFEVLRSPAADPDMRVYAAMNYATLVMNADKDAQTAKQIAEALAGSGGTVRTRSGLVIIPKANNADVAAQAGILIQRADLAISGKAAAPQAAAALASIIAQSGLGKYTYETASLELADIYASSTDPADKAKALGMYSELLGVPGSSPTGLVKAPIAGGNAYNILRAKLGMAQTLSELKISTEDAKKLFNEVLAANKIDESMQIRAAVGLADLLKLSKDAADKMRAFNIYTAIMMPSGSSANIDTGQGIVTVYGTRSDNASISQTNKALIGFHEIATASKEASPQDIASAIADLRQIAYGNDPDSFNKTYAKANLADLLSRPRDSRPEAEKLFAEVLGETDNPFLTAKASLGIALINLEKPRDSKEFEANLAASINAVVKTANDPDESLSPLRERAAIALGTFLSSLEEFSAISKAMSDRLIGGSGVAISQQAVQQAADKFSNSPYYPRSFRKTAADVINANSAEIASAINGAQQAGQEYIIGAALNQRGQVQARETSTAAEAVQDFARAQAVYANEGNDKLSELQARTGQVTAAIASMGPKDIEASIVELMAIHKEYQSALATGEIKDQAPYLEADILLGMLRLKMEQYSALRKTDRNRASILSGQILEGYKTFLDGTYPPEIRTLALQNYATALNTFGMSDEAQRILTALEESPDYVNSRFTSAETLKNMGILSIGDSDPKLAVFYFDEADKRNPSDPTSKIYLARAMYLTERFNAKEFSQKYDEALSLLWTAEKANNRGLRGSMPDTAGIVSQALTERGDIFKALQASSGGRAMILTALEADAKQWQARGDDYKAAVRYEKAIDLLEAWEGTGLKTEHGYMFESQLRYDLASAYLCLDRMYDAYQQYLKIDSMGVAPGWWIEDQLRLLNPETLSITTNNNEDLNIAYRRAFERGHIQLSFSKDGGSAEGFFFVNPQKTLGVRMRLGAYNHGSFDAGLGIEYNRGKVRANAGIDYSRSRGASGSDNEIIGIKAGVETKLNRHLTIGLKGKVDLHYEDFDYTTWELTAYARYARKIDWLGKNATFFANLEATYGTKRVEAGRTRWIDDYTASQSYESQWQWGTDINGTEYSYTTDSSRQNQEVRSRYWHKVLGYDDQRNEVMVWSVKTAIEPGQAKTESVTNPYFPLDPIDIKLARIYSYDCMVGNSIVNNSNRAQTARGARPTSAQIDAIDVEKVAHGKKEIYREFVGEKILQENYTRITVMGERYNEDREQFDEPQVSYIIEMRRTPLGTTVTMSGNGYSKVLYQGHSEEEAILKIAEFYRIRGEMGVTKAFHLKKPNITVETTLSLFGEYESTSDVPLKENEWANTDDTYRYGLGLGVRAGQGPVTIGLDAGIANTNGDWDTYWSMSQTLAMSPEAGLTTRFGPNGLQGNVKFGNVGIGLDSNANPSLTYTFRNGVRSGNTQLLGETTVGISAAGPVVNGVPLASANPAGLAIGSLVVAYNSEKNINNKRAILRELTIELFGSDDPYLSALLKRKLDDKFVEIGQNTANWLQDSSRIPVLNILTMLGGTRRAKNEGIIERETGELLDTLAVLGERGAFDWMENEEGELLPENELLIRAYAQGATVVADRSAILKASPWAESMLDDLFLNPDDDVLVFAPEFEEVVASLQLNEKQAASLMRSYEKAKEGAEEKHGVIRKIADGITTPIRGITRIFNPKNAPGKVSSRSFRSVGKKTGQIWQDLISAGYIDQKGVVLSDAEISLAGLSEEKYTLTERYKITQVLNESIKRRATENVDLEELRQQSVPSVETEEELRSAMHDKLFEDSMYLIYRLIDQKGNSPETRAQIGQILAQLPPTMRKQLEHFVNQFPAEYLGELNAGVKVAVERPQNAEAPAPASRQKPVLVEAEVFAREALAQDSTADRLALEESAVNRVKGAQPDVLAGALFEELKAAIASGNSDGIYSAAIGLFTIAGTSPSNAGMIAEILGNTASPDFAVVSGALNEIRDKLVDFYTNRRPGSKKVFGGRKEKVKVEGAWGNGSRSLKAEFTVEEYIAAAINGRVMEQTILKNARTVAMKDFKGVVTDTEALWSLLVNRGYVNQNGVIMQDLRQISAQEMDLPYHETVKADIFAVLTGDKTGTKPAFVRDRSIPGIRREVRTNYSSATPAAAADETTRARLDIRPVQETPAEQKAPVQQPVEDEKAARAARRDAARQRYGVGPHGSRRR